MAELVRRRFLGAGTGLTMALMAGETPAWRERSINEVAGSELETVRGFVDSPEDLNRWEANHEANAWLLSLGMAEIAQSIGLLEKLKALPGCPILICEDGGKLSMGNYAFAGPAMSYWPAVGDHGSGQQWAKVEGLRHTFPSRPAIVIDEEDMSRVRDRLLRLAQDPITVKGTRCAGEMILSPVLFEQWVASGFSMRVECNGKKIVVQKDRYRELDAGYLSLPGMWAHVMGVKGERHVWADVLSGNSDKERCSAWADMTEERRNKYRVPNMPPVGLVFMDAQV